jgi:hypothetical protein
MNDADAEAAYARCYVPAPGRVVFQAAFANLDPHSVTRSISTRTTARRSS